MEFCLLPNLSSPPRKFHSLENQSIFIRGDDMDDLWVPPILTNHIDFAVKLDSSHPKQRDPQFGGLHDPPAGGVFLQDLRGGCQSLHSPSTSHQIRLNRKIFKGKVQIFSMKVKIFLWDLLIIFRSVGGAATVVTIPVHPGKILHKAVDVVPGDSF